MELSADVHDFLGRENPGFIATIATNGKDGFPLVVPVWYRWDRTHISIWTGSSRLWARNVMRDSRVGVSIQDVVDGTAVIMRGDAKLVTRDDDDIDTEIRRISRRYVTEAKVETYMSEWASLDAMVYVKPTRVFVWQ
ncbi:MAG: hypothetical protein CMO26_13610 [Thiotrichales bacterium]|nr:hypothetical protein [Thiotrichales bacterium]|tara:strand:- start:82 stop:492 length:411 start_codon:yes stop_codon:yes gene_type:complete